MKLSFKKVCNIVLSAALVLNFVNLAALAGGDGKQSKSDTSYDDSTSGVSEAVRMFAKNTGISVERILLTCPDLVSVEKAYERAFAVHHYKITTRFGKAISEGDLKTVEEMVRTNPNYLNDEPVWKDSRPEDPDTPLCLAIKCRQFEIVKFLVDNGAIHALHCRYARGGELRFPREYMPYGVVYSAFCWAISHGFDETDTSIIEYLLSHGFRFYDEYGCSCPRIPAAAYQYFCCSCDEFMMIKLDRMLDKYDANLR